MKLLENLFSVTMPIKKQPARETSGNGLSRHSRPKWTQHRYFPDVSRAGCFFFCSQRET